jgi:hypothetical protein
MQAALPPAAPCGTVNPNPRALAGTITIRERFTISEVVCQRG